MAHPGPSLFGLPMEPKLSSIQTLSLPGSTLSPTNFPPEILFLIQGSGQCSLLHEARDPSFPANPFKPMGLLDISDFYNTYLMHVFLPH